ncbi:hypothetical protein [Pseudomonas syringae group sp. J254-4]|uniref:hypothetical protein n=1 Tax=Pseudomonas syringae group sp. J254-4 TaxID=3079589 RepID=UPI002915685C|nr:hypothetical protein [Pseudomonas syringae group sp. J254-4]MDU8454865.1 hypothetical protein [Pseudomonas syringae group sp. J254-4]
MSNEFKLVPGIWHPINAINDGNRYEPSFLLHCPDLICSDFNPSGVVEGHWCDDEGWQAAVWCGYHDEFHTKFVTPMLIMTIPSIAAPQPPALGGELVSLIIRDLCETEPHDGADAVHLRIEELETILQDRLAPLQAENSQLRQHKIDYMEAAEETRKALQAEITQLKRWQETVRENSPLLNQLDQIKAQRADLEKLLARIRGKRASCLSSYWFDEIDAALSKPAGSEKV